jgi:hypothetical protein
MPTGGGSGGGSRAIEAGRAFVRLFTDDSAFARGLAAAEKRLAQFSNFALKSGAGLVGVGTAILAPLTLAIDSLNDLGKQGQIASALGLTSEQFTGIAGVAGTAGEETREFIESLVTLGKLGTDAANGTEQASQAFKALGLNAQEFIKLRADEQFFAIFEALHKLGPGLTSERLLMKAFGEDGGKYLLPLLEKTPAELRAMARGFAVSTEDMAEARKAQVAYTEATAGIARVWRQVVVAVAPVVTKVASAVAEVAKPVAEFVTQNRQAVQAVVGVGAALVVAGGILIATGIAAGALSAGIGVLLGVLGAVKVAVLALFTPVGLLAAVLAAAAAGLIHLYATSEEGQGLFARLRAGFGELVETITTALGGIRDALAAGDLALAGRVALTALQLEWAKVTLFFQEKWNDFTEFWVEGWYDGVKLIKLAFNDLDGFLGKVVLDVMRFLNDRFHETFKAMLRTMAAAVGLFDEEFAKNLRKIADAPKEQIEAAVSAAERENERKRQQRENEIERQAAEEKAARAAGRQADADEIRREIDRLQQELNDQTEQAAYEAWLTAMSADADAGVVSAASVASQLAGSSRGAFSGPLAMQLGVGDIDKKQLDTLTDIKNGKGGLAGAIGGAVADQLRME